MVALVERERCAEAEQHQCDDKRVEVSAAAVAELVQAVRVFAGAALAEEQQGLVRGVGHQCTDSASIDELPVMMYPVNFATAMPALAARAAMIALVLPELDIAQLLIWILVVQLVFKDRP